MTNLYQSLVAELKVLGRHLMKAIGSSTAEPMESNAEIIPGKIINVGTAPLANFLIVPGSLLRNIQFPGLGNQERFILTRPLELRFTAPFQHLSDHWSDPDNAVDASYLGLSALEAILRDHLWPK